METNIIETNIELTPAQLAFLESSIDKFSVDDWRVELAGQAASTRRFFRIFNGDESYILVEWDSRDEDWPRFLDIEAFAAVAEPGLLPKVYDSDPVHGLILEEDLGTTTLKRFCEDNDVSRVESMYRQVIDAMRAWHRIDVRACSAITSRAMDTETFLWESDYFAQRCVTDFFGKESLLTPAWEEERARMAGTAAGLLKVNMHRDFQSENIMIRKGRVRFIDFQGARLGPAHYDAASLLFDPYIDKLSDESVEGLIDYYLSKTGEPLGSSRGDFHVCAAQRLMQALGAYGNLALHKGKPRYREFIPVAIERLARIFNDFLPDYPAMREVVNACKQSL